MPLDDHFAPPLSRTHPWRGFHDAWAVAMARHLNQGVLPPGYYAIPTVEQQQEAATHWEPTTLHFPQRITG